MTLNKLASLIAKREGKRSQARIGDIREILKIIVELNTESMIDGSNEAAVPVFGEPLLTLLDATNKRYDKLKRKRGRV